MDGGGAAFIIVNANKIMKSLINANSLSPWSDELDLDAFLAPPPAPPLTQGKEGQRMEEEAKKTLLSMGIDK